MKIKDRRKKMNLPNKLSIFRIILVPIMAVIPIFNIQGEVLNIPITFLIINIIFIIASITDKLDGYIARKNNQITEFGKIIDSVADKILVVSAMIILVQFGKLPSWIAIIVTLREILVMAYKSKKSMAANMWGRIKAVMQIIAIILAFIDINNFGDVFRGALTGGAFYLNLLVTISMIIAVIATILSGWNYLKDGKDLMNN